MRSLPSGCHLLIGVLLLLVAGLALLDSGQAAKGKEEDKKWSKEITNDIGMKLVRIPAGKFTLGSPATEQGRGDNEKQHEVEITKDFWLGIHEVTQKQFKAVMGYNPSYFSRDGKGKEGREYRSPPAGGKEKVPGDTSDFPVENVSWEEAQEFCKKLTKKETKDGREYRLPTEAQWEYSCRSGASSYQVFHVGPSLSSKQANFDGYYPYGGGSQGPFLERTCKVGSYKANGFGLYDMHGNVREWCADQLPSDYQQAKKKDPKGPDEDMYKEARGGCWDVRPEYCRSAARHIASPTIRNNKLGFRVALVPSK